MIARRSCKGKQGGWSMASHKRIGNLFELNLEGGLPQVVRWEVPSVPDAQVKLYRDAIAFELGRKLQTAVIPSGAGFVSAMLEGMQAEESLTVENRKFKLVPKHPMEVSLSDRRERENLRRLLSADLKRTLVYEQRNCWYRASAFFPHNFTGTLGRGLFIVGLEVDILVIEQRLFLAIDRKLTPVGPALDSKEYGAWRGFIRSDPYSQPGRDEDEDDGNLLSSFSRVDVISEKRRNYIVRVDGHFRRMYVDIEATSKRNDDIVVVEPLHDAPDEKKREADRADVYPILAPGEINRYLGPGWKAMRLAYPEKRMREATAFVRDALGGIRLLGRHAAVSSDALHLSATKVLPWPRLTVGRDGKNVVARNPEERLFALQHDGFRDYPTAWRNLEIVAVKGRADEAEQLRRECENWISKWQLPLNVTICPIELPAAAGPRSLKDVFEHYEQSPKRPSLLLVFMPRSTYSSNDTYQDIHQLLGRQLHMHVKPVNGWGNKSAEAYALNCLGSLLARGGAIPYGLGAGDDGSGLAHDFVIGVDVGGRDRASRDARTQYLSVIAVAGDEKPTLWRPMHPDELTFSGEQLTEELVRKIVLEPARKLGVRAEKQRGWLYMRDGRVFPEELKALHTVVKEARAERLLGPNTNFMVVEVHKSHALRMFTDRRPMPDGAVRAEEYERWDQPTAGAVWWFSKNEFDPDQQTFVSEALISSTGDPCELASSADPLRCFFFSLNGAAEPEKAARDVWHLSHLNWRALGSATALPMPLHAAQEMAKELNDRGGLWGWPF